MMGPEVVVHVDSAVRGEKEDQSQKRSEASGSSSAAPLTGGGKGGYLDHSGSSASAGVIPEGPKEEEKPLIPSVHEGEMWDVIEDDQGPEIQPEVE